MTTVFINGCFDLFHVGHLRTLQFAADQGSRLIVGLNSDRSVRALKGPDRPIVSESERLQIIYAFGADEVIIYDEPTPFNLVVLRRPDVLVVGCDHLMSCRSCKYVRDYGGEVVKHTARVESTSELIERIRK